jgi:RNA polymerase sigma-70 factor (ECF subfamily)
MLTAAEGNGSAVDDQSANLLDRWRGGDQQAAEALFQRYVQRLIAVARSRLSTKLSRRIDAEDVIQSAYRSFFLGVRDGRYLFERGGDLWRLLVAITLHKLQHQVEVHTAGKRSIKRERPIDSGDVLAGIDTERLTREPSPLEAAAVIDELERIMRDLEPLYRRMVELRLQGHSLEEIAADTKRSERTVRRVFERIKEELEGRAEGR